MKDLHEDNLFGSMRERLDRYEEAPSEELWKKIASRKSKRSWMMFVEPAGIVLIGVLLLFSTGEVRNDGTRDTGMKNETTKDGPLLADTTEHRNSGEYKSQIERSERTSRSNSTIQYPLPNDQQPIVHYKRTATENQQADIGITKPDIANRQLETRNYELETPKGNPATKSDSTNFQAPVISKRDSSSTPKEVVPPYKKPKSRFQFYLSVTPSLSFQKMIPTGHDDLIVQGFEPRSSLSMKRFGFAIDAGFQRDITKVIGYYGGLSYYHQEQQLSYRYFDKQANVTRQGDTWVFEINRQQHTKTFDYSMNNIGARAGLLITVKGEKLKHKFGAGLNYMHSLSSSSSYVAYQLSYRNEFWINDRVSWFIKPTFIYSFFAKEKLDEPFRLKPYRAGISGGVLYRF